MGRSLVWLTPPGRRRALMSLAALGVGAVTTVQTMAHKPGLPVPAGVLGLTLLVLAQFALLALVYWSALRFAALPPLLRRHPQNSKNIFQSIISLRSSRWQRHQTLSAYLQKSKS